jgi:hypothetical protein
MLPTLKARVEAEYDLLAFADTDALRALEVITSRRPAMVLLEQRFAATPRGGALINRIKADPSLAETQVRIAPADPTAPVIEAEAVPPPKPRATRAHAAPPPAPQEPPPPQFVRAAPLDHGTRRIPRVLVADALEIVVDGNRGTLVDICRLGAQILTSTVLKPNQRVRITMTDTDGTVRCGAVVVWATFEIPRGAAARYRAGVEFIDADAVAVEAYGRRHPRA